MPWSNHWRGTSELADYSGVETGLRELARMGYHDEVVELGGWLFEKGLEQVEHAHDEGETGIALASCFQVIAQSFPDTTVEDHEKVLLAIDWLERDEYEFASSLGWITEQPWPVEVWADVANALLVRLEGSPFESSYRRQILSTWAVMALDQAEEAETADALCEVEAVRFGEYLRLVERYVDQGREDEARDWAARGFKELRQTQPGTAERLADHQAQLAHAQKDWRHSAAFAARSFFERPSIATLTALESAAAKARCKAKVRALAITFLQEGVDVRSSPDWPLPPTGLEEIPLQPTTAKAQRQPHWEVLRDLALKEDKPAIALEWHDRIHKSRKSGRRLLSRVHGEDLVLAEAVAPTHPDRAIEIYLWSARERIQEKKPSSYAVAGERLGQVRDVLVPLGRADEWENLLASFRDENRRRPRMREVLDGLEGRPIVSKTRKRGR